MSGKAPALPKRQTPVAAAPKAMDADDDAILDGDDDDEIDQPPRATTVSKKRRQPDVVTDEDESRLPQAKANRAPDVDEEEPRGHPIAAAAAAAADEPPAAPMVQEIKLSPFIVYPAQYKDGFDVSRITFSKDAQASREGGGQILFMSYLYDLPADANGKRAVAQKPFLWNTPNGMHLPMGVTTWKDGKVSVLASCGDGWEANPIMAAQVNAFEAIRRRCIEVVVEKQWNSPNPNTFEAVDENFAPIMFVGMDAKGTKTYPPSVKASIIVSGKNKTDVFEYSPQPPLRPMLPTEVAAGSQATLVLHVAWIYRKKLGKLWKFSVRLNAFQIVAEPPSLLGNSGAGGNGAAPVCAVQF